jgi:hypothetical protein
VDLKSIKRRRKHLRGTVVMQQLTKILNFISVILLDVLDLFQGDMSSASSLNFIKHGEVWNIFHIILDKVH